MRLRMTTWRWMLVVAAIGLMIGGGVLLKQRRDYFLSLAQSHQREVDSSTARGKALKSRFGGTSGMTTEEIMRLHGDYDRMMDRADHHASLARKYERAARYPWLPVEPDPPEPEWIPSDAKFESQLTRTDAGRRVWGQSGVTAGT